MSDSKHVPEKWRAEDLRAQRKARLARMKAKDGGKKPIQTRNPKSWIILAVIVVVALIGTGVWTVVRLGVPQRRLTALTIGSEKVKVFEVNYYYHFLLSNYGIDPATDDGKATLSGASGVDGFPTVAEYIKDIAAKQVQENVMLYDNAIKSGIKLEEADNTTITGIIDSYKDAAQQAGAEIGNYLVMNFGIGMTLSGLREIIENQIMADKFITMKKESMTFTDDEIQTYYDANKDTYDIVDYRIFTIKSEAASDASDSEKSKALEAARTKANEMLARISDEASFKALCIEFAAIADKAAYTAEDKSLNLYKRKSDLTVAKDAAWLFDAARNPGDKTVADATNGYSVLYMVKRSRDDFKNIAVRHILIQAATSTATKEELTAAKTKAEDILKQYLAGEKTEAAFGELAKTNSADGNASEGGIYNDVGLGTMVAPFNDWCFDSIRKPGDTGIVQTIYGYHIMYFVGVTGTDADWKINVKSALRDEAYNQFVKDEITKYPYRINKFSMRFVA